MHTQTHRQTHGPFPIAQTPPRHMHTHTPSLSCGPDPSQLSLSLSLCLRLCPAPPQALTLGDTDTNPHAFVEKQSSLCAGALVWKEGTRPTSMFVFPGPDMCRRVLRPSSPVNPQETLWLSQAAAKSQAWSHCTDSIAWVVCEDGAPRLLEPSRSVLAYRAPPMCRHLPSVMPFASHTHPCEKPPPLQMRKLRLMLCPRSQVNKSVPTTLY